MNGIESTIIDHLELDRSFLKQINEKILNEEPIGMNTTVVVDNYVKEKELIWVNTIVEDKEDEEPIQELGDY